MVSERRDLARWWVWAVAGVILAALVGAVILWWRPVYDILLDQEQVRAWIEQFGAWGPIAIVLMQMIQAILAPVPGQAIQAVSGYLYGPWLGTLYSMGGLALGSFLAFALARRFGRPLAARLFGQQSMDRMDDLVHRGGVLFFFLIWLFPFAPDDLICFAAGITSMATGQFLVLMILGRIPGVFVSVLIGASAPQVEPAWWLVLFGAIAVVALVWWRWGEQIQKAVLGFLERLSKRFQA